jgi:hypothetical protein
MNWTVTHGVPIAKAMVRILGSSRGYVAVQRVIHNRGKCIETTAKENSKRRTGIYVRLTKHRMVRVSFQLRR